jgi:hypothetical protein
VLVGEDLHSHSPNFNPHGRRIAPAPP